MASYKSLPDNQLIQLLRESDHAAYTEIYNRYFSLLYKHAYNKLQNEYQAEDVIQEVFSNLWFRREFIKEVNNLPGYLYGAIRHKIFDLYSREESREKHYEAFATFYQNNETPAADHLARERNFQAYIQKEVDTLPHRMKEVFNLSKNENLSRSEIAEQLGITENNVSRQLSGALKLLKGKLGILIFIIYYLNH